MRWKMKRLDLLQRGRHLYNQGPRCIPRVLVFLLCSLMLFAFAPRVAGAVSASTGHISGQLLNGSQHDKPIANQSVTLQMTQGNNARDLLTLNTDAQGRYSFSTLDTSVSIQYAIYAPYQGAHYVTDLIDLSKDADQQVNLRVYDATTSTSNLAVVQATILIDKPNAQSGMLTITEDFVFENLGLTSYVGSLDSSQGKPNALLFSLPAQARFLSLTTGFDGYESVQVDAGFASTAAVLPGTSEFSFSFQIPYSGTNTSFTYQTVYPTLSLSAFTPLSILTTSQGLTGQGPASTKSGTYQLFTAKTLGADKSVSLQLDGLPAPSKAAPAQAPVNSGLIWLVVLLIMLIALTSAGGYLYSTRRRRATRTKKSSTSVRKNASTTSSKKAPASKEALLQELLELDKAYEAHKMKKAAYQEQRSRLKARLRNLMSEQSDRPDTSGKTLHSSGKGEK